MSADEFTVRVRLFARAKEVAGAESFNVVVPTGSTIADLRQVIIQDHAELASLMNDVMFAVDNDYATDATELTADANVACIPPVSGG